MSWYRKFGVLSAYVFKRFLNEGLNYRAASLVYATLLSLVPFALIILWVMSLFPFFKGVGLKLQGVALALFVSNSANEVSRVLGHFVRQLHHLSWVNLIVVFVISILLLLNMTHAFNTIWQLKKPRSLWITLLIDIALVIVMPVLIGIGMLFTAYLKGSSWFTDIDSLHSLLRLALLASPYILTFVAFAFMNWVMPATKVRVRYALAGGFVTAILFEIAKYGFAIYLTYAKTYAAIYGALATIPLFLLWVYLSWVLVLFGALLTYALSIRQRLYFEKRLSM